MNQVVAITERRSVLRTMSERYGMEPGPFEKTLRATVVPNNCSQEQLAAFLLVANQYGLNPVTREIYAFPARNGGVVPIVSIDGWVNLVNSHGQCDGFEFDMNHDQEGNLISCTCRMYRKDRKHPVTVTEYLSECVRSTEPWKMKHRMLRHKAMIQAARYAFGFAGIYDEDEGRTIADDVNTASRSRVPSPSEVIKEPNELFIGDSITIATNGTPIENFNAQGATDLDLVVTEVHPKNKTNVPDIKKEYDGWFSFVLDKITHAEDGGWLETFFNEEVEAKRKEIFPSDINDLADAYAKAQERLNAED